MKRWLALRTHPSRSHDQRTCTPLLHFGAAHLKIVQERLGRANISVTLGRYFHVTMAMDLPRDAADQHDAALSAISPDNEAAS